MWQLHAASPLRSATYISKDAGANQIATACYVTVVGQRAAAASQPAVIGLLPAVAPTNLRSYDTIEEINVDSKTEYTA